MADRFCLERPASTDDERVLEITSQVNESSEISEWKSVHISHSQFLPSNCVSGLHR